MKPGQSLNRQMLNDMPRRLRRISNMKYLTDTSSRRLRRGKTKSIGKGVGDSMTAKEYLQQVEKLDLLIQNKLAEKRQWLEVALGITAHLGGERVQTSGSKSKMAEAVEKCIDVEREISALIDRLIDTKSEIVTVIELVENPTEYDVLHKRYIQKMSLLQIADRYGKEYSWATTTHGRALKSVQDILDKKLSK